VRADVKSYANEKLTIAEMEVPSLKNGCGEFEVQVTEPGIVRHVAYRYSPRAVLSISQGAPEFDVSLAVYLEISPGAPLRNRRFCVMRPGTSMVPVEGHDRVYLGTALLPQLGEVAHLYEIRKVQS
jgi:hypothetical protein